MMKNRLKGNSLLRDETQGAAERKTQAYVVYRQGLSEHATKRFARKMDLYVEIY